MIIAEQVLVVPTHLVFSTLRSPFNGFQPGGVEELFSSVIRHGFFAPRDPAEEDPGLKQIIPYGMLVWRGQVFLMKRSRTGGEARLHERFSLGVGGHVNPVDSPDGNLEKAIRAAFQRELEEELSVETSYRSEALGLLNDDSNPVGRVHLGLVYRLDLAVPEVRVKEKHALEGSFVPVDSLASYRERMETWSQILQDSFWPNKENRKENRKEN
jgi:predicted NUDIX family phosphoesterase